MHIPNAKGVENMTKRMKTNRGKRNGEKWKCDRKTAERTPNFARPD